VVRRVVGALGEDERGLSTTHLHRPTSPRFNVQHPHRMSSHASFPPHYRTTHRHIWVGLLLRKRSSSSRSNSSSSADTRRCWGEEQWGELSSSWWLPSWRP